MQKDKDAARKGAKDKDDAEKKVANAKDNTDAAPKATPSPKTDAANANTNAANANYGKPSAPSATPSPKTKPKATPKASSKRKFDGGRADAEAGASLVPTFPMHWCCFQLRNHSGNTAARQCHIGNTAIYIQQCHSRNTTVKKSEAVAQLKIIMHKIVLANVPTQATDYAKTRIDHEVVPFVVELEKTRNQVLARTKPIDKNMAPKTAGFQRISVFGFCLVHPSWSFGALDDIIIN